MTTEALRAQLAAIRCMIENLRGDLPEPEGDVRHSLTNALGHVDWAINDLADAQTVLVLRAAVAQRRSGVLAVHA